jgi:hypothetical protein
MTNRTTNQGIEEASRIMERFAERTGLTSERPPQRYLWTDAFAVCNFLGLSAATGDQQYTELALRLVDQVHRVLGRYRDDDGRTGWVSGLGEGDAEAHPTRGGLRIGKKSPERRPGEVFDDRLEWDRDGQYFHYLTKWMHALDQVSRAVRQAHFNLWARELAVAAHHAFVQAGPERTRRRMAWKMSADLSRVLVPSMGHHDPLDGFITCAELEITARGLPSTPRGPDLEAALTDFAALLDDARHSTIDPLGLGGLLTDACHVAQMMRHGAFRSGALLDGLLAAALDGLVHYLRLDDLRQPASRRLAFRELGLAIGLSAIELIARDVPLMSLDAVVGPRIRERLTVLRRYAALGSELESFWLDPEQQRFESWSEHRDINEVMLATRLVPLGFLGLSAP